MPLFPRSAHGKVRDRRFHCDALDPFELRILPAGGLVSALALTLPGTDAGGAPVDGAGSQSAPPATPLGSPSTAPVDGGGRPAPPPTPIGSTGSPPTTTAPAPTMLSTLTGAVQIARQELAVEVNGLTTATIHRIQVLGNNPYLVHHPRRLATLEATTLRTFTRDLNNLVAGFRAFEIRAISTYVTATKREATLNRQLHGHPNQLARQQATVTLNFDRRVAALSGQFHKHALRVLAAENNIELETQRLATYGAAHPNGPLPIRRR